VAPGSSLLVPVHSPSDVLNLKMKLLQTQLMRAALAERTQLLRTDDQATDGSEILIAAGAATGPLTPSATMVALVAAAVAAHTRH
jgi:hypothetical protein